jgi:uncharacterized small protein (DUF1192 family)
MSETFLKWVAGVAAAVAVIMSGAALTTWADVRAMKDTLAEQKLNAIKAERIAALEADVANLKADAADQDRSHSAMWQAIGKKADK